MPSACTPPEERYDRVAAFAAAEFDVPICVISLVDDSRQWFKARVGVDVVETITALAQRERQAVAG